MPTFTHCVDCGVPNQFHPVTQRCRPCGDKRTKELAKARLERIKAGTHRPRVLLRDELRDHNNIAHKLVAAAIRYGFLLPASAHNCVDCGDPATGYDHRDYNKPLEVQPVCTRCNNHRGPGVPLVLPKQQTEVAA